MNRCPNCGACKECGAPKPFTVYPQVPYIPAPPPRPPLSPPYTQPHATWGSGQSGGTSPQGLTNYFC